MKLRDIYPAPADFVSDGCTVPAPLKPVYRRYAKACRWHDWARRHLVHYGVMTTKEADWEFRHYMKALGAPAWLRSITWVIIKLARNKYSRTLPVPPRWEAYLKPRSEMT